MFHLLLSQTVGETMSRLFPLALLCLVTPVFAQAPAAQSPAPQTPPPSAGITLKARSQLVIVDVVVTDKHDNPIHGLKASDFTLLENDTPQTIRNFEEHKSLTPAEAARLEPMPALPPGIFTNFTPAPANGAVNILLLDSLNTPLKDQSFARQEVLKYLGASHSDTRIAVFGLNSRLVVLQGFTSDPEILRSVVNSKAFTRASPVLDDASGTAGLQDSVADNMQDANLPAQVVANMRQFEEQTKSYQVQLRARITLDALNQIGRYLANIPGRKNLIWFSGAFPINILPFTSSDSSAQLNDPFAVMASFEQEFRETSSLLARGQVAVYPIDARGLATSPVFDSASSRNYTRPGRFTSDQSRFEQENADEHSTMRQMAEATGGRAFVNTNGLSQAVTSAVQAGANFYTLTYTPPAAKSGDDFRRIKIKTTQSGLKLEYRRGYYAEQPAKPTATPAANVAAASAPAHSSQTMQSAMLRGSPTPSQIIFKARILPASTASEDLLAPDNRLNPSFKNKGPYRRINIDLAADANAMQFTPTPESTYRGAVEIVTAVYDIDGNVINSVVGSTTANVPSANYARLLRIGFPLHQQISVPAKGSYFLRIAVHDLNNDRVGAIELPVAAVKNLPPLPAPPASAPSTTPAAVAPH